MNEAQSVAGNLRMGPLGFLLSLMATPSASVEAISTQFSLLAGMCCGYLHAVLRSRTSAAVGALSPVEIGVVIHLFGCLLVVGQ